MSPESSFPEISPMVILAYIRKVIWGFPGGASGKEPHAKDMRDVGLITGTGRFPGGGHATHYSIVAWRIPWIEEPGRLQSIGSHRVSQTRLK